MHKLDDHKKESETIEHNAIQCLKCNDIIYSRFRSDMRYCTCRKAAIDGGFDYLRIIAKQYKKIKIKLHGVSLKTILYSDWRSNRNEYGLLKENESRKSQNNIYCGQ